MYIRLAKAYFKSKLDDYITELFYVSFFMSITICEFS